MNASEMVFSISKTHQPICEIEHWFYFLEREEEEEEVDIVMANLNRPLPVFFGGNLMNRHEREVIHRL